MALEKIARGKKEKLTQTITTKLTESDYKEYIQHLERLNLTQSEATRFLILNEIASAKAKPSPPEKENPKPKRKKKPAKYKPKKERLLQDAANGKSKSKRDADG